MSTFYIDGPDDGGEGLYCLVADTGERLASHFCSDRLWARYDLVERRTKLQDEWRHEFGEFQVVYLGNDEMTRDELVRRNREVAALTPAAGDVQGTGE